MTLLSAQHNFRMEIIADDDSSPPSSLGMTIYRDAYRARLLTALEVSFEKTLAWTGAEAFHQAACHYILTQPPAHWSLDTYGAGFPDILSELFGEDAEVAELAWLEWHMQRAFAAPDCLQFDPLSLAQRGYSESDWDDMTFSMAAGFASRIVSTNLADLWAALAEEDSQSFSPIVTEESALIVWRSALSPTFCIAHKDEHAALQALERGERIEQLTRDYSTEQVGQWLARWFSIGLFSAAQVKSRCKI